MIALSIPRLVTAAMSSELPVRSPGYSKNFGESNHRWLRPHLRDHISCSNESPTEPLKPS
jgi:hypothetical protein